jgi:VanZ family protein
VSARRWVPPALWAALILLLTSIPNPDVGGVGFPGADKIVHGMLYLVLGWLVARAIAVDPPQRQSVLSFMSLLAGLALFAALDEWHQQWISGRSADVRDWGADLFGAMIGIAAARIRSFRREPLT